jgi:periplasmic divalent cation tolerance protein
VGPITDKLDRRPRSTTPLQVLFYRTLGKTQSKKRVTAREVRENPRMEQLNAVVVLTTWPEDIDPGPIAEALVERRLAACVNVLPAMDSVYRWQGAVERGRERQLVVKTTQARIPDLLAGIKSLHPYEVPEVLVLPVAGGGEAYLAWIRASVAPPAGREG